MKGRDGKMIESIVVPKGMPCMLGKPRYTDRSLPCYAHMLTLHPAVLNVNTSKDIWGPDAAEFK